MIDVAAKVQQEVLEEYRLDGVAGVGSNKLIAQTAATLIQPSELYDVRSRIAASSYVAAAQPPRGDHTAQVYPNPNRVLTFVHAELSRGQ